MLFKFWYHWKHKKFKRIKRSHPQFTYTRVIKSHLSGCSSSGIELKEKTKWLYGKWRERGIKLSSTKGNENSIYYESNSRRLKIISLQSILKLNVMNGTLKSASCFHVFHGSTKIWTGRDFFGKINRIHFNIIRFEIL